MPKGYLVGHINVTDLETYKTYQAQVPDIIKAAGGRYLIRGGDSEAVEGEMPGARTVVLEFDTLSQAKAFYHSEAYAKIIGIRHEAASGSMVLVEGIEAQP